MNVDLRLVHSAFAGLLDRQTCQQIAEREFRKHDLYLQDLVNYGTNLFVRCDKSLANIDGTPASLIHLFYHAIQMADGIQVLCSRGCFEATFPLLRSLLEADVSVHFMLTSDFRLRSTAWSACYFLALRQDCLRQSKNTKEGKGLRDSLAKDRFLKHLDIGDVSDAKLKEQLTLIDKKLSKPKFKEAVEKLPSRNSKWHSVDGGPKTIYGMFKEVQRAAEYTLLYDQDSQIAHAKDGRRAAQQEENGVYIAQLRKPDQAMQVYSRTAAYLLHVMNQIGRKLRPAEELARDFQNIVDAHGVNNTL